MSSTQISAPQVSFVNFELFYKHWFLEFDKTADPIVLFFHYLLVQEQFTAKSELLPERWNELEEGTKELVYFKRESEFRLVIIQAKDNLIFIFKSLGDECESLMSLKVGDYINQLPIYQASSYQKIFKMESMIGLFAKITECIQKAQISSVQGAPIDSTDPQNVFILSAQDKKLDSLNALSVEIHRASFLDTPQPTPSSEQDADSSRSSTPQPANSQSPPPSDQKTKQVANLQMKECRVVLRDILKEPSEIIRQAAAGVKLYWAKREPNPTSGESQSKKKQQRPNKRSRVHQHEQEVSAAKRMRTTAPKSIVTRRRAVRFTETDKKNVCPVVSIKSEF